MKYSRAFRDEKAAEEFIDKILSSKGIAPSDRIDRIAFPDHSERALYLTRAGLLSVNKKEQEASGTWLVTIET